MSAGAAPKAPATKGAFSRLINYIASASEEEIKSIEIEEMAIASAWYTSMANTPEKRETFRIIPEAVDWWLANVHEDTAETEGRRRQPLFREILDKAVLDGINALSRSELDIIVAAYDLTGRVTDQEAFERLRIFFSRKIEPILRARKTTSQPPGLAEIEERLHIITSSDIEKAKPRSVKTFSGIELPTRGPLYAHSGNVKVLDFVPDDCTLVVEDGSCFVGGYVLGRVAAAQDCEVRDNVSGVVVVTNGDVRVRSIIGNAYVVSKSGGVYARNTESPKLVFGGSTVVVRGDARMGAYIAPTIEIDGDAIDGEFSVSKSLSATRFRQSPTRRLVITLRRNISGEDYGEYIDPGARHVLAHIVRTRQRRDNQKVLKALAVEECEHLASSGLMYLLAGEELRSHLEMINSARHRLAILERLIAGADSLSEVVEERLILLRDDRGAEEEESDSDPLTGTAKDVEKEMRQIESEQNLDEDLSTESSELRSLSNNLYGRVSEEVANASVLSKLRSKRETWVSEREKLHATVSSEDSALRAALVKNSLLGASDSKLSKTQLLNKLLGIAYKRPIGDPLADRAQSDFVQLMLRFVETRRQRISNYSRTIATLEEELGNHTGKLKTTFHLSAPPDTDEISSARATGSFEPGITVCTDQHLLDESEVPPGSLLTTLGSGGETTTYAREDNRIVEVTQ